MLEFDAAKKALRRLESSFVCVCVCVLPSAATTPSLTAVCDFEQSLCGWSADPLSGVSWSLHTASSGSTGHGTHGTRQDLALGSDSEYRVRSARTFCPRSSHGLTDSQLRS